MCVSNSTDDTYMYDDAVTNVMRMPHHQGHWYDEPPYESDPDDFLMSGMRQIGAAGYAGDGGGGGGDGGGGGCGPSATIQGGRVCYTTNGREGPQSVISLRSAGDISIPQRGARRGLIVPQQPPNPPTIIPLKHARSHDRESGDYAGSISDLHSVTSRLSQVSIGMNNCTARYRTLSAGLGDESPSPSPTPSSEYDDILQASALQLQKHLHHHQQLKRLEGQCAGQPGSTSGLIGSAASLVPAGSSAAAAAGAVGTVGNSSPNDARTSPKDHLLYGGKDRSNRDYSNCLDSISDQTFQHSASSVESLPSASGSSTQALVRPGSPHSSLSAEDRTTMLPICRAIALVDSCPSPYDKEALRFKKGDIIDVLSMNASGVWRGYANGRLGHFKFISVEVLPDLPTTGLKGYGGKLVSRHRLPTSCPTSVEELLLRIGLKEYTSVFVLNGYEDLELFKELEPSDLDYLGIGNTEHRAKILAAVQLLHDLDSTSDGDVAGSSSENDEGLRLNHVGGLGAGGVGGGVGSTGSGSEHQTSPFGRRHFPRDSGCYEGSPVPSSQGSHNPHPYQQQQQHQQQLHHLQQQQQQSHNNGQSLQQVQQGQQQQHGSSMATLMGTHHHHLHHHHLSDNETNNLDSVVAQCSNEILKRVESARRYNGTTERGSSKTMNSRTLAKKGGLLGGGGSDGGGGMVGVCGVTGGSSGGALSEKSSDSGVSSSSLSSGPAKGSGGL
uniref:SH3 domain-containing protein n=1 Tax=Anopheles epiroticus TaxID=199890 RepID=A0A182PNN7_9DIPT